MADLNEKVTPIFSYGGRALASLDGSTEVNVGSTERLLSVAGGLLLFGWGMYRRGLLGYGAIATGAALCDRGIRGRCGLYSALGKTTAEPVKSGARRPLTLPQVG